MALIDPLKILPRFTPAPMPSQAESRFGERIALEVIQNELVAQRENDRQASEAQDQLNTLLSKDHITGLNPNIPYQKRGIDAYQAIATDSAAKMQAARGDAFKMKNAVRDAQLAITTNKEIGGALQDAATVNTYTDYVTKLGDKGNAQRIKRTNEDIFRTDRDYAITLDKLNIGAHAMDIYDVGNKILLGRQATIEKVERDENGKIVAESSINTLVGPDETEDQAKARHKAYLESRYKVDFLDYNEDERRAVANNVVNDMFEKNRSERLNNLKTSPTEKAVPKTYEEKQAEALENGGVKLTGDYVLAEKDASGKVVVYELDGENVYDIESKWDELSMLNKKALRSAGVDLDNYKVAGSNKKINGGGLADVAMGTTGLGGADVTYMAKEKARAEITEDGYVETNNPAVLEQLGLTLKYNKTTGTYTATDNAGKELKEGDFTVTGGAKMKGKWIGDSVDMENSSGLNFRVKVSEIKKKDKAVGKAADPAPADPAAADSVRADGTPKGKGYLGELKMKDGSDKVETELSIGVTDPDGNEVEIPTLVPTLTSEEKEWLLTNGVDISYSKTKIAASIRDKAVKHASERISKGKSPFADDGTPAPTPAGTTPPVDATKQGTPAVDTTTSNYIGVQNKQYKSMGAFNKKSYDKSWQYRPADIDKNYDAEIAKGNTNREKGALLTEAGYAAIEKFEFTKGDPDGKSMKGKTYTYPDGKKVTIKEGYAKYQEKEIRDYVEENIGMDVWNKMPEKLQTQIYSFAFNSVKDKRIIQGLAQSLAPDEIKTDEQRRALSVDRAKEIIKGAFSDKPVEKANVPDPTTKVDSTKVEPKSWNFPKTGTDSTKTKKEFNYGEDPEDLKTDTIPPKPTPKAGSVDKNVKGLYSGNLKPTQQTDSGKLTDRYGNRIETKEDEAALPEVDQKKLPERFVKGDGQAEDQWKEVNNKNNVDFAVKFAEVEKAKGVKITYDSYDVKDSIEKGYFSEHAANTIVDLADIAKERKVNELRITGFIHHITRDKKKPHNFDLGMNPAKDSMNGMFTDKDGKHSELLPETAKWLKKHGYALVIENNEYESWHEKSSIYGSLESGSLHFMPEAKDPETGKARGPHYSFEYVGKKAKR